jgi:hypothetical protein
MAITYPVTFPTTPGIARLRITPRSVVSMSQSPFTGQQQVYKHQGQWWEAEVTLPAMTRAEAESIVAFLLSLDGSYGTFTMGDPIGTSPRGIGTGTPLVKGAAQTGQDLLTDGWTANQTGILKAGDWIQLGTGSSTKLYKVLVDTNSNASGEATLTLFPKLRSSPSDNQAIYVNNTKGLWRLAAKEMPYEVNEASIYGITFACIEAL